eukprot:CAMPEP_0168418476 /NCGR_PEP_ID=MMETSP0228-20121227/31783_1 /TAXON_ID=133427 /ORGANISM="Protoceratium reticulatum, Strain CCCM 535 (=CCMP 1889)" /LENGTH=131 /DNA_ID=CAMNT_0008432349 /DNA_START=19 /DNA_END=411 /DNA_ORIENTATION=+
MKAASGTMECGPRGGHILCPSSSAMLLGLSVAVALGSASGLPTFRTPASRMPTISDCAVEGSSNAALNGRLILRRTDGNVVKWFRPSCAMGGVEVKVDVFLIETNIGEIGLGESDCADNMVELRQPLNNTW